MDCHGALSLGFIIAHGYIAVEGLFGLGACLIDYGVKCSFHFMPQIEIAILKFKNCNVRASKFNDAGAGTVV